MLRRFTPSSVVPSSATSLLVARKFTTRVVTKYTGATSSLLLGATTTTASLSAIHHQMRFCSTTIKPPTSNINPTSHVINSNSTTEEKQPSNNDSTTTASPNNNTTEASSEQNQEQQRTGEEQEYDSEKRVRDSSKAKLVERIEDKPGFFARYWRWFIVGGAASGALFWVTFDHFNDQVLTRCARFLVSMATVLAMYKFTTPESEQQISDMNTRAAQTLLRLCQKNEGLYIKFGQQIHSFNQVLPPEYSRVMKVLLDGAPDVDVSVIREIIRKDLGESVEDLFIEWSEKPIASASIAQVHRAKLRTEDGKIHDVAVKVQKPNIKNQMWWDLQCYFLFCYCVYKGFNLPVWWSAQHIAEKLSTEIDFRKEADHIDHARELLLPHADSYGEDAGDVYVPKVFHNALSPRVLCTEWVDSVKLHEKEKVEEYFDVPGVMTSLVRSYADLVFQHGFVHADPHPANVLVRPHPRLKKNINTMIEEDEREKTLMMSNSNDTNSSDKKPSTKRKFNANEHQVVYIDWGLATRESDSFKKQYAQLFKAIFMRDEQQIEEIVSSWGISDGRLFSSMLMQKPINFEKDSTPVHSSAVSKDKILEMQRKMKEKATSILQDESKTPKELILLGRGMNLIRSVNKSFDAPVNRVNILAERAARSLGAMKRDGSLLTEVKCYTAEMKFHMSLAWLSFVFHFLNWYSTTIQWLSITFVGKKMKPTANLETVLDDLERQAVQAVTGRAPEQQDMNPHEFAPHINAND